MSLALTLDAVPVIIECKRKDNPDMRYIVAQLFEYASKLNQKTYSDLDGMASEYLSSPRCQEEAFRNLSLEKAYNRFTTQVNETEEMDEKSNFKEALTSNLREGEFYLLIIADQVTDAAFQTVEFLNKKLNRLRIEIIEVSKFKDRNRRIYVPNHINRVESQTAAKPGKITLEEMLANSGIKEKGYINEFLTLWKTDDSFSIEMGTVGFSAKYKGAAALWVFPDQLKFPNNLKNNFPGLHREYPQLLKKHFPDPKRKSVRFDSSGFNIIE